ncbi:LPS-induced tumor necrosis factor alpha factor [Penicillium concentricum]|uniref:LPS-induced tumor necrosis factor alpha factor n=1 Tax=Penicillium concentricum TaxID=293559 RepID=A0A9W9UUH5_9EURO|nr:LPS-induced tumor necrosis factor alpha factor [Penicillium concentricum]KAJ5355900.1 LPS-induced tumor necrosis factor alpha factor [Penicillium concentricum]
MTGHPGHPSPTPTPVPIYSEAPEAVYPTHPTQGPVSPHSDHSHTGQSLPDALHSSYTPTPINGPSEKEYPFQPDSIGQAPAYDATSMAAPPEKAYAGQPLTEYPEAQTQPQQFYTPSGHPSGYVTAVPLHAVQSAPCPVDCPVCGKREMTRVEPVSGGTTHGWAAILCFCCCLGCIPYLMSSLKDVEHSCGKCGAKLAKWHNSGRVDVLQNGARK